MGSRPDGFPPFPYSVLSMACLRGADQDPAVPKSPSPISSAGPASRWQSSHRYRGLSAVSQLSAEEELKVGRPANRSPANFAQEGVKASLWEDFSAFPTRLLHLRHRA